jgi:membrane protease YdiL (CAAX protease family)
LTINKLIDQTLNQHGEQLAPFWHTGLTLFLLLIVPLARWSGSKELNGLHWFSLIQYRELLYIVILGAEWGMFAIVYSGVFPGARNLPSLIGKTWTRTSDGLRDVAFGTAATLVVLCSTALLIFLFGPFDKYDVDLYPKTAVQFYFFFLMLVSGGFAEEIIFRGYLQKQLRYIFKNDLASVSIQALVFSLSHGVDESVAGMSNKFLTGVIFGIIACRRKSLIPTIVAHCGLNAIAAIAIGMH